MTRSITHIVNICVDAPNPNLEDQDRDKNETAAAAEKEARAWLIRPKMARTEGTAPTTNMHNM